MEVSKIIPSTAVPPPVTPIDNDPFEVHTSSAIHKDLNRQGSASPGLQVEAEEQRD